MTQMNYSLSLVDNMVVEDTETFFVSLSLVTDSVGVELGTDSVANITILDDDKVTVEFEISICDEGLSVTESRGSLAVNVTKTGLADIPVTVFVQSVDRTATGGIEFWCV